MRRRVKEQLKRIGGMEFWDTNFSYIDKETQEESFVGLPEEKGSHLIENTPLLPGVCYTSTSDQELVPLFTSPSYQLFTKRTSKPVCRCSEISQLVVPSNG